MRRLDRAMTKPMAEALLLRETMGVLSMVDPQGEPYAVPLNYYYSPTESAIFFHCAMEGKKLRCLRGNPRTAFTVAVQNRIDGAELTTYYESVIAFGAAAPVTDEEEKLRRLIELCRHLAPDPHAPYPNEAAGCLKNTCVIRMDITALSGKHHMEPEHP